MQMTTGAEMLSAFLISFIAALTFLAVCSLLHKG